MLPSLFCARDVSAHPIAQGEAERQLVRVPVECCLMETAWNPYYALLLRRLTSASPSHGITLQYRLWDLFKTVSTAEPLWTAHLARLTGTLIASAALPLSALKVCQACCLGCLYSGQLMVSRA